MRDHGAAEFNATRAHTLRTQAIHTRTHVVHVSVRDDQDAGGVTPTPWSPGHHGGGSPPHAHDRARHDHDPC
jgi:hypothetical protein